MLVWQYARKCHKSLEGKDSNQHEQKFPITESLLPTLQIPSVFILIK